jgi:mRNA-degrading endonuclease toxin of MazEF toxin-antitoxin module
VALAVHRLAILTQQATADQAAVVVGVALKPQDQHLQQVKVITVGQVTAADQAAVVAVQVEQVKQHHHQHKAAQVVQDRHHLLTEQVLLAAAAAALHQM